MYKSEVKSFRRALVLTIQDLFIDHTNAAAGVKRSFSIADVKSAFVTRIRRSCRARRPHRLDVGTGQIVLRSHELLGPQNVPEQSF